MIVNSNQQLAASTRSMPQQQGSKSKVDVNVPSNQNSIEWKYNLWRKVGHKGYEHKEPDFRDVDFQGDEWKKSD